MTDPFREQLQEALAGAYTIDRELKGGGMSRVFVAVEHALQRTVVVKVLKPDLAAGVNRERFRREIMLAAQLQHPHIVPVLSAGERGDLLWYTMPFVEGESLREGMVRQGQYSAREVVRVLHDVLDALSYAHSRGVIHRDIKPGNILTHGSHALVTDFGVAKALSASMPHSGTTSAGIAIGTPAYMAPEQLAADPKADHRVDLYAVGLLGYELLTGEQAFSEQSPAETMAAQLTRMPQPIGHRRPDVPDALTSVITRLLAKSPNDRPPDARAALDELEALATPSSGGILASTVGGGTRSRVGITSQDPASTGKSKRRTVSWAVLAVVLLVATALGLQRFVRGSRHSPADSVRLGQPAASPASGGQGNRAITDASKASDSSALRNAPSIAASRDSGVRHDSIARLRTDSARKGIDRTGAKVAAHDSSATRAGNAAKGTALLDARTKSLTNAGAPAAPRAGTPPARSAPPLLTPGGKQRRVAILPVRDATPQSQFFALARALEDSLKRAAAAAGYALAADSDLVRLLATNGDNERRRVSEASGIGAIVTAFVTMRDRELQAQALILDVWKGMPQSQRAGTEADDPNGSLSVVRDVMRALNRVSWRQRTDPKRVVVFDVDNQTGSDSLSSAVAVLGDSLRTAAVRVLGAGAQSVGDSAARATKDVNDRRFVGLQLGAGALVATSISRRGADSLRVRVSVRDLTEDKTFDTAEFVVQMSQLLHAVSDIVARLGTDLARVNWGPKAMAGT